MVPINPPGVGEICCLEGLELVQGTSRGGWCWLRGNYLAFPGMPEEHPRSPSLCGDVLGAPGGSGSTGTICLPPRASLPLQELNNEKRRKEENRQTRRFCASSSPAAGSSSVCYITAAALWAPVLLASSFIIFFLNPFSRVIAVCFVISQWTITVQKQERL